MEVDPFARSPSGPNPDIHLYGKKVEVRAVSRILQLRNFKVVVVEGVKEPILLLSTDISLTAAQIIEIYGARFRIELAIRGLKQHFGLADYQCYLGTAIHRFVHLACAAFCVSRLIQLREDTSDWLPPVPDDVSPATSLTYGRGCNATLSSAF